MQNHQLLSWGRTLPWLALVLAVGGAGCSADMNGATGEDEASVEQVGESVQKFNNDYVFFQTAKTWAQAEAACVSLDSSLFGYHLAVPRNAEEQVWLHAQEDRHGGSHWWLGVNDQKTEGQFMTGVGTGVFNPPTPIVFNFWHAGEPNNSGNEDCVMDAYYSSDHGWNDSSCGNTSYFVCQRSLDSVGLPTTPSQSHPLPPLANTNNALQNFEGFTIPVVAGQKLTLGTCGLQGAVANGDTVLRLYPPTGSAEVAFSDDGCNEEDSGNRFGSNISIIVASTGDYKVRAGCYENTSCSGTVTWNIR